MKHLLNGVLAALLLATQVLAVEPDEMLDDPVLETRARAISKELRCVVCQNQDIDSSNAGVARDLRILVRERLELGDTDGEVVAFIRARYGDYVLMSPPLKPATYALWFAPIGFAGASIIAFVMVVRRRRGKLQTVTLSDTEDAEFEAITAAWREGDTR